MSHNEGPYSVYFFFLSAVISMEQNVSCLSGRPQASQMKRPARVGVVL